MRSPTVMRWSGGRTAQPDVIVTDISMPRLDGIEAARRILATNRDCPNRVRDRARPSRPSSNERLPRVRWDTW